MSEPAKKTYSFVHSLVMLLLAIATIVVGKLVFSFDTTLVLLCSTLITSIYGCLTKVPWKDIQDSMVSGFKSIAVPVIMLLEIGILVGSWMISGTIPTMMYYGLRIIDPRFFLVMACILCALISSLAGTSYGTVSTVGVALAGIATGFGIPLAPAAGAIVVGSWFGDSMSPLSDSTVMVSNACNVPLLEQIRHNMYTTIPAFLISLLFFFFYGLQFGGPVVMDASQQEILSVLENRFVINPFMLLPPVIVFVLIFMKKPTLPVFAAGIVTALLLAIFVQGQPFADAMAMLVSGFNGSTGSDLVDTLVNRGGMNSMMSTVSLVLASAAFSAPLRASGCVQTLLDQLERVAKTDRQFMLLTTVLHPLLFIVSVTYYVSYTFLGDMMSDGYERRGLSRKNLARIMSDTGVCLAALIPWGAAGAVVSSQLGITAWDYAIYAPFNWLCLVFGVIYIFTGFGIANTDGTMRRRFFAGRKKGA